MSDNIHIKLPDGGDKEFPKGTTALDVAKSISPRLADAAIAAKTNGNLIDLTRPLEKDTDLRILTERLVRDLELIIRLHPEQWHMPHRIWEGSP